MRPSPWFGSAAMEGGSTGRGPLCASNGATKEPRSDGYSATPNVARDDKLG